MSALTWWVLLALVIACGGMCAAWRVERVRALKAEKRLQRFEVNASEAYRWLSGAAAATAVWLIKRADGHGEAIGKFREWLRECEKQPLDKAPRDGTPILARCVHAANTYVMPVDSNTLTPYGAHCEGTEMKRGTSRLGGSSNHPGLKRQRIPWSGGRCRRRTPIQGSRFPSTPPADHRSKQNDD